MFGGPGFSCHGALRARNQFRQAARSNVILQEGRPVVAVPQRRRDKLLAAFHSWLQAQGFRLASLLEAEDFSARLVNQLIRHGRELYNAGWPYSHYSELVNAFAGREGGWRPCLQPAWDLAFAWLREEPHSHHVALRAQGGTTSRLRPTCPTCPTCFPVELIDIAPLAPLDGG